MVDDTMRKQPIFIYTMTAGLGDLVVLGTVARWVEESIPGGECFFIHRGNPNIHLWQKKNAHQFFNVYSCAEMLRFVIKMRQLRREGRLVFGLQMAPGSVQGFFFLRVLQKLGTLDYVVDFNIVNADIITPPRGDYILNQHAQQIMDLCRGMTADVPQRPKLPFEVLRRTRIPGEKYHVGLHPWSRRGYEQAFVWQQAKWLGLIECLLKRPDVAHISIFGRDNEFERFRHEVMSNRPSDIISFSPSGSVPELAATIAGLDLLVTVNTGVVHIAYALDIPMVILNGPSLDLWIPKGKMIISAQDRQTMFQAPDRAMDDDRFSQVGNIRLDEVEAAVARLVDQFTGCDERMTCG
jgi:hypothetical protein